MPHCPGTASKVTTVGISTALWAGKKECRLHEPSGRLVLPLHQTNSLATDATAGSYIPGLTAALTAIITTRPLPQTTHNNFECGMRLLIVRKNVTELIDLSCRQAVQGDTTSVPPPRLEYQQEYGAASFPGGTVLLQEAELAP